MLFNTYFFFIFFVVVFALYLLSNHRWQNRILLISSYFFYGSWDWRFLSLIFFSTVIDYYCGLKIDQSSTKSGKRLFLWLSMVTNLGLLGFFKYFNFFAASLANLLGKFGVVIDPFYLEVILPVGISFYTFQTMSYSLDIYKGDMKPTRHFWDFALYVAFFPQLVAGPIERAKHLLPQMLTPRKVTWDGIAEGSFLIYWGLFQKVVIADNMAKLVDPVFMAVHPGLNGISALIAIYAFAFQIYGDFAGYSNIARGLSQCMGFDIMVNFNLPYFAKNPSEFWQRWHISLSSWLRDYLYIPLGGNRGGFLRTCFNLMMTMLLGGLWHGAAWTYIIWGGYHGALLIAYRMLPAMKWLKSPLSGSGLRKLTDLLQVVFFFHLVCLGWLIFRADWMSQVVTLLKAMVTNFHFQHGIGLEKTLLQFFFFIVPLLCVQIYQYRKSDLMAIYKASLPVKAVFFGLCNLFILVYGVIDGNVFIYFQF